MISISSGSSRTFFAGISIFCTSIMAFFYNNVIPWWNAKIILPF
nr:MAG TPA: hypothetical protein [Bacteriophage sp.]